MTERIRGVLAPVVTPFKADLSPDSQRFTAHWKWLLSHNCGLADSNALLHLIRNVQTSGNIAAPPAKAEPGHLTPACPRCGSEMQLKTARRGANLGQKFWGCPRFPKCWGRRPI